MKNVQYTYFVAFSCNIHISDTDKITSLIVLPLNREAAAVELIVVVVHRVVEPEPEHGKVQILRRPKTGKQPPECSASFVIVFELFFKASLRALSRPEVIFDLKPV